MHISTFEYLEFIELQSEIYRKRVTVKGLYMPLASQTFDN